MKPTSDCRLSDFLERNAAETHIYTNFIRQFNICAVIMNKLSISLFKHWYSKQKLMLKILSSLLYNILYNIFTIYLYQSFIWILYLLQIVLSIDRIFAHLLFMVVNFVWMYNFHAKLYIIYYYLLPSMESFIFISRQHLYRFPETIGFYLHAFRWNCVFLSTHWSIHSIYVHLSDWYLRLGDRWIAVTVSALWRAYKHSTSRNVHTLCNATVSLSHFVNGDMYRVRN